MQRSAKGSTGKRGDKTRHARKSSTQGPFRGSCIWTREPLARAIVVDNYAVSRAEQRAVSVSQELLGAESLLFLKKTTSQRIGGGLNETSLTHLAELESTIS